jgi:cytochrome c553
MKPAAHVLALFAAASALAGCNRHEEAAAPAPAPAASSAAAPASAPAPSGPVIAPVAAIEPTDAQRTSGSQIAAQGGGGAVAACNSCHGAQGEGNAAGGFPRIAGQSYAYLAHELETYANGTRKHPIMQPIAAAMTPDQRKAAAAYFASLNPNGSATAAAGAASAAASGTTSASASTSTATATRSAGAGAAAGAGGRGAQLANVGDNTKGVQACANCHGPGGIGSGELYPYLAGQHANYLTATLGAWRDGTRANDPSGQMPLIAQGLTPQDIAAIAAYYAGQPPRATAIDAEHMAAIGPAAAASGPAITSGPQAQAPSEGGSTGSGTGTESGAPSTGGSQGAGVPGGTGPASTGAPQQGASAAR